ncbi:quinolinate synthase NadA [Thermoactinomyces mirandus]|uniref:Quinolinate synthase n=1 Tax=Thermoactinomyces mirandus TaxID=2756294 RepID=A0A7W1XR04_9BACL|nr:quinolinate synthase NadA [Thermoactinomyces mirandus]MBA4601526.1 quinolinate synthase NadA [Thermoactinomyces mirandus]
MNYIDQDLPEIYRNMSSEELDRRIQQAREKLGSDLVILGHHYQRDDVIKYADFRGDSLRLAKIGTGQKEAKYIVFCGVHFMAETAETLSEPGQTVFLPDLRAGCSMADMADIEEVEEAWEAIQEKFGDTVIPLTYVNSTAAVKAFVGKHGGTTCTSSNAHEVMAWAFARKKHVFFLPDQHLGRNTAYFKMGIPLEQMVIWDPVQGQFGDVQGPFNQMRMILWKGHCSVHQKFTPEQVRRVRERDPEMKVIVHPECSFDVVKLADDAGSTGYIIKKIGEAPAGSRWAIGTEVNLVQRLAQEHPEQHIELLSTTMCPCLTMNRIDRPHLLWTLESIIEGKPVHVMEVNDEIKHWSKIALDRMLTIK